VAREQQQQQTTTTTTTPLAAAAKANGKPKEMLVTAAAGGHNCILARISFVGHHDLLQPSPVVTSSELQSQPKER
jgi:hypothetical protein